MVYPMIAGLLTTMVVFADIGDFNEDYKRWKWLKSWSKPAKISLFVGCTVVFAAFWMAIYFKYV